MGGLRDAEKLSRIAEPRSQRERRGHSLAGRFCLALVNYVLTGALFIPPFPLGVPSFSGMFSNVQTPIRSVTRPAFLWCGSAEPAPLLTCSSNLTFLPRLHTCTHVLTHTPTGPGLTGPGWVSPAVLKLLKMATGMRALLDTVVQALPQVGEPVSSSPSCLSSASRWALETQAPTSLLPKPTESQGGAPSPEKQFERGAVRWNRSPRPLSF